ncbi:hypothetical protein QG37_00054 [Candidozyma auris]|uniref:Uncharacterized protein n=1 Tax=Candidozyma auris TaxID=498019 RepID=A0A0L0P8I6_CANAR|nr:hypothetical protein QG37_00054 [[Candida] auris]
MAAKSLSWNGFRNIERCVNWNLLSVIGYDIEKSNSLQDQVKLPELHRACEMVISGDAK